jgi:hypothetical protein
MHDKTEYNESGQVGPGEVCAVHTSSKDGDVYKILYAGQNIYHPTEHKRLRRGEDKKFRSVSKEVFEGYLSFLVGREERKYRQISRIFNG